MGDFNLDSVRLPDSDDEVDVQSKFDERFFRGKVKKNGPIRIYFVLTFNYLVADIEIRKFQKCIGDFSEHVRRCKNFSDGEREKECSKISMVIFISCKAGCVFPIVSISLLTHVTWAMWNLDQMTIGKTHPTLVF